MSFVDSTFGLSGNKSDSQEVSTRRSTQNVSNFEFEQSDPNVYYNALEKEILAKKEYFDGRNPNLF